jgi:hypothetical protein
LWWYLLTRIESTDEFAGCRLSVVTCQPNKNVFFSTTDRYTTPSIGSFTMTIPTNMTRRKRNRIALLHAQAAFPSNASSKGHFEWKMPHTEQLTIDV